jgi:hypothetical protein
MGIFMAGRFAVIPTTAVLDPELHPTAIRVLAVLASYADKEGWCWPSQTTLGESLGVSRQAIQRQLAHLEDRGYIESARQARADGGETSKKYRIRYDYDVAPPQPQGLHPLQHNAVAPPATSEVARTIPSNDPIEGSIYIGLAAIEKSLRESLGIMQAPLDVLTFWRDTYSMAEIESAIGVAREKGKRHTKYVAAVLASAKAEADERRATGTGGLRGTGTDGGAPRGARRAGGGDTRGGAPVRAVAGFHATGYNIIDGD